MEQDMAGGWARDGAIQDQIDASIEDEVRRARTRLGGGLSRKDCAECREAIPEWEPGSGKPLAD